MLVCRCAPDALWGIGFRTLQKNAQSLLPYIECTIYRVRQRTNSVENNGPNGAKTQQRTTHRSRQIMKWRNVFPPSLAHAQTHKRIRPTRACLWLVSTGWADWCYLRGALSVPLILLYRSSMAPMFAGEEFTPIPMNWETGSPGDVR